jgi:hypothetical protein
MSGTHSVQSVVVNGRHAWECRQCGNRWHSSADHRSIERERCHDPKFCVLCRSGEHKPQVEVEP